MRRIHFLQVGDLHYPDWRSPRSDIDAKDAKFSPSITRDLRGSAFRAVLAKLNQITRTGRLSCIAFMGDFTSRGDSSYLRAAFQHFTLLCKSPNAQRSLPLFFVPGNHDVNRVDARELGPIEKFSYLQQLAEEFGWMQIPMNEPLAFNVNHESASSPFILMNTAIGSWELQNLPELLRDKLKFGRDDDPPIDLGLKTEGESSPAAPASATGGASPKGLIDQYYSQLDTPYVSSHMLAKSIEHISSSSTSFGVIVAHHNLLPQKTPRISPYSELLNAGFVRSQLLSADKPIIYLHGHIHQDPIEIISDPQFPNGKIVLVSAPEIQSGFNEIVLFLTEQNDLIGMRIVPHRASVADGKCVTGRYCFIPTLPPAKIFIEEGAFDLLRLLKEHRSRRGQDLLYWSQILEITRGKMEIEIEALEDLLLVLHASQLIEIDGLNKANSDWRIAMRTN